MIEIYGWSERLQHDFAPYAAEGLVPGRVIVQQRGLYGLITDRGEVRAEISGKLARDAEAGGYPAAGDWVAISESAGGPATVHHVLPRRTAFTRKASGPRGGIQVVAANVDVAFLTVPLAGAVNARALERYLAAAWQSGAQPIVLLTKADLCADLDGSIAAVEAIAVAVPVHAVSSVTGAGLEILERYLTPGRTAVLVGSSGAGKSTLVNALTGANRMVTQAVREDDGRGRHTTSHRELILLPGGGLLLDTPGMRELGLWEAEEGLGVTFDDIEAIAAQCRFSDCSHGNEPGCAVRAALESGEIDDGRWRGYQKLRRELEHLDAKEDPALRAARRRKWVQIHKANRAREKLRGKG